MQASTSLCRALSVEEEQGKRTSMPSSKGDQSVLTKVMVLLSELIMAFSSLIVETDRVLEGITLTGESVADADKSLCETV